MLVIKVGYIMPAACGMCLCVRNLPRPAQGVSLNPCLAVEVNAFKEEWFAEPLRNAMLSKLKFWELCIEVNNVSQYENINNCVVTV